jgi:hypothetical protein
VVPENVVAHEVLRAATVTVLACGEKGLPDQGLSMLTSDSGTHLR